jgi:hypothetical protein
MQLLWKLFPHVVLQKRTVWLLRNGSQQTGHSPSTGLRVAGTAGLEGGGDDLVDDSCSTLSDSISASRSARSATAVANNECLCRDINSDCEIVGGAAFLDV